MIIASKNGVNKTFSEHAWNLLGKSKSGWKQNSSTTVENSVNKMPKTGEVEKATKQTSENIVDKTENIIVEVENSVKTEVEKTKSLFYLLAEDHLTKNLIKDYFDNSEVKYKTSDSLSDLINALEQFLVSDVDKLKLHFNL